MKRVLFSLLLFISCFCSAQIYKYISVENGLSSRMVYSIKKDKKGYMWFLTHDGIDRFDGKRFKHYKLIANGVDINSFVDLNRLYTDTTGCIWEIGKNGQIFKYNTSTDSFQFICDLDKQYREEHLLNYAYIDNDNNIWLGTNDKLFIYNIDSHKLNRVSSFKNKEITDMVHIEKNTYCFSTPTRVYTAQLENFKLKQIPEAKLDTLSVQVSTTYYHRATGNLYIGSVLKGVFIYNFKNHELIHPEAGLQDININCINALSNDEILVATDGAGVYKINAHTFESKPYIVANYNEPNSMNGNNISDIYVDDEKRIWMANYPMGITVLNNRYPSFKWIKHSIGNEQSLINDQVNAVIEDSDGDIWFATNNGISLYHTKSGRWTNLLSSFHHDSHNKNHIFVTLCETSPGHIWAGGYTSGMYWINKKDLKPHYFVPQLFHKNIRADKYIRAIYKDSQGLIWVGGYYYLKCIDINAKTLETFNGVHAINAIIEKDPDHLWIGCTDGLYVVNKTTKKIRRITLPAEANYINVLYQGKDGMLYIGTNGYGLVAYNPINNKLVSYNRDNSALISNSIYSILSDEKGTFLILSTENSLSRFDIRNRIFSNWTSDQGLSTSHFNATSGTYTSRNTYIIGSGNGAVEFNANIDIPRHYSSKLIFSDFRLFYQPVFPNEKNSPLTRDIDETKYIELSNKENLFSLNLSSINYDYPSNILFSWKLDGFYDKWSKPGPETLVRYTNLIPGNYKLLVRAISKEDQHVIEERELYVTILPSFWTTIWAMCIYLIIGAIVGWAFIRYYLMIKDQKTADDKINFFINTAHDIRTPLTLIKGPLDDLQQYENLSVKGSQNLQLATRSANNLFALVSNLADIEGMNSSSNFLNPEEQELLGYIKELVEQFESHAESKKIKLTCECDFTYTNVWFDKSKMDAILKNLLMNALKYTPANGSVNVHVSLEKKNWNIEIKDTGIGIPAKELKDVFNKLFRASNAISSSISGTGIGLVIVRKFVSMHGGKISVDSIEGKGTTFKLTFPQIIKEWEPGLFDKLFRKMKKVDKVKKVSAPDIPTGNMLDEKVVDIPKALPLEEYEEPEIDTSFSRIVVVEDNDDLRTYLKELLSDNYSVYTAENGEKGLNMIRIIKPDLVISDIMMPVMNGEELCRILKSDLETSHIPIILLTAKATKQDIIQGLRIKADQYLTKPFDPPVLKAMIKNVLDNHALLRKKFAQMEIEEDDCKNCSSLLDFEFMAKVKKAIETNLSDNKFTVDTLAANLNMSRTSFYTKLKALTGEAPKYLLRDARLNKATQLLSSKQYQVTEISEMAGFGDVKHFREVFKKSFGVTPSQYANGITSPDLITEENTVEENTEE